MSSTRAYPTASNAARRCSTAGGSRSKRTPTTSKRTSRSPSPRAARKCRATRRRRAPACARRPIRTACRRGRRDGCAPRRTPASAPSRATRSISPARQRKLRSTIGESLGAEQLDGERFASPTDLPPPIHGAREYPRLGAFARSDERARVDRRSRHPGRRHGQHQRTRPGQAGHHVDQGRAGGSLAVGRDERHVPRLRIRGIGERRSRWCSAAGPNDLPVVRGGEARQRGVVRTAVLAETALDVDALPSGGGVVLTQAEPVHVVPQTPHVALASCCCPGHGREPARIEVPVEIGRPIGDGARGDSCGRAVGRQRIPLVAVRVDHRHDAVGGAGSALLRTGVARTDLPRHHCPSIADTPATSWS